MNPVPFVLLFVCVAFAGTVNFSPVYNATWSVDDSTKIISFHLSVARIAWIAIGFHAVGVDNDGEMVNADVVIAVFTNGKADIGDYFSTGFAQPDLDTYLGGKNNLLTSYGKQENGITTVNFTRQLVTGDDYDIPFTLGPMNVIWAIGIDNVLDYHGPDDNNRGYQYLNIFPKDECGPMKGCSACVKKSQCVYCSDDTLCYYKNNVGECFGLNTTCMGACANQLANSWVPDNFCASVWADGLRNPRGIVIASNNDILVVESTRSVVTVLWEEADGTVSRADLAAATSINHGIAINGDYLYASSTTTLYRWKYQAGMRTNLGSPQPVVVNIVSGGHSTRTIVFDNNGDLYISSGSGSNVDPDPSHAQIRRYVLNNIPVGGIQWSSGILFAVGLRNEVGIAFDNLGRLWGVENGCDNLNRPDLGGDIHIDNPSEEVNLFETEGKFYGYPYCWSEYSLPPQYARGRGTQWVHPNFMNDGIHSDGWCRNTSNVVLPSYNMGAHQAPLDVKFYYGNSFPAAFTGGAFVSLHGSWNRNPPQGYRVIFLTFSNGLPTGESVLLRYNGNSQNWPNNVRPVGLSFGKCGADDCLYVTSDSSGQIIKISYEK